MQRIKDLNYYQKALLIVMAVMALVFAILYPKTISRVGYQYNNTILILTQENGNTLYSGKLKGKEACFTVSDNTVLFQYGDKTYGPYTIKEDPTAIPKDHAMKPGMTGIEVLEGDTVYFRGGVLDTGAYYIFYNADGTMEFDSYYIREDGVARDTDGNPVDRMRPTVSTIYDLINNPELTHKGKGIAWFGAVFISILNVVSILFADELFRFSLSFSVRNADTAEPTEWEMSSRYIGWTVITIGAFVIYITGLHI